MVEQTIEKETIGLSPRVRGNPRELTQALHQPRSIPACAGEPGCAPDIRGRQQVYPRVCGGTRPA